MDAPTLPAPQAERKTFETLRAKAALAGIQLHRMGDGTYSLARWNMHRGDLPNLQAVRVLLRRMGIAA